MLKHTESNTPPSKQNYEQKTVKEVKFLIYFLYVAFCGFLYLYIRQADFLLKQADRIDNLEKQLEYRNRRM